MPETCLHLKYGSGSLPLTVPAANLLGILEPVERSGRALGGEAVAAALASPIGVPRLAESVGPGARVAIVVSDVTRPVPTATLLPPLLAELGRAGVRDDQITVVFGLGIHRGHTPEERRRLVGPAAFDRVRCVDFDPEDCVDLGTTSRGTPIRVSRLVAEADVRICTGNVEYHYFAGYSGGAKALLPGVCHRTTVERNHSLMLQPGAVAGRLVGNPVREDIEEAGERIGADFVLNVVLDARREIVAVVAGGQRQAIEAGARLVDDLNLAPIDRLADVVVVSAGGYPKDLNLYQAQKALDNAQHAVREGGAIVLAAECREGLGEETFAAWMESARRPEDLVERLRARFVLGGHKAAALALTLRRADLHLVSSLSDEHARSLFFLPAPSLDAALAMARAKVGQDARVLVMPNGGSTLPRLRVRSG